MVLLVSFPLKTLNVHLFLAIFPGFSFDSGNGISTPEISEIFFFWLECLTWRVKFITFIVLFWHNLWSPETQECNIIESSVFSLKGQIHFRFIEWRCLHGKISSEDTEHLCSFRKLGKAIDLFKRNKVVVSSLSSSCLLLVIINWKKNNMQ